MKIIKSEFLLILFFFLINLCIIPVSSFAEDLISQELEFSGSPNPVGSGARALGMGGAFIGVADDATAASWNPGGLIQLEKPEISFVLSYEHQREHRTFTQQPGATGTESVGQSDLNYVSAAWPFTLAGRNMIVSLNYQTLYDMNREVSTDYFYQRQFPGPVGDRETMLTSEGYLKALSPAYAVQITPAFSFGLTVNWFSSDLGCEWETDYRDRLVGSFADLPYQHDVQYSENYECEGINFNLGFLWRITDAITLGAVYKSAFDADLHFQEIYEVSGTAPVPSTVLMDEDQTLKMPQSYGIGIAWRSSDAFSAALDIYRTDWQDFVLEQADGTQISLFTGRLDSEADTDPTHQVRLGAEYLFIRDRYVIPVRAGFFYDPEPTDQSPDDFFGFSLGGGFVWKNIVVDAAYQYRWGNDVRKLNLLQEEMMQDVEQHRFYTSMIFHF